VANLGTAWERDQIARNMASVGLNYRRDSPNRSTEESPTTAHLTTVKRTFGKDLRLAMGAFQDGDQQLKASKLLARRIRLSFSSTNCATAHHSNVGVEIASRMIQRRDFEW
jgi:hypothetical protein